MGGIKYYQLSKDEELPDEFCAVKDIGGEPSEYTFYVPEAENAKLQNELDRMTEAVEALHSAPLEDQLVQTLNVADKLRKLAQRMWRLERFGCYGCRRECDAESCYASDCKEAVEIEQEMRELGIEVPR